MAYPCPLFPGCTRQPLDGSDRSGLGLLYSPIEVFLADRVKTRPGPFLHSFFVPAADFDTSSVNPL